MNKRYLLLIALLAFLGFAKQAQAQVVKQTQTQVANKAACDGLLTVTIGGSTTGQPLTTTASSTPASCNGGADGTATATPAGGSPGYTYAWTTTDGSIPSGQEVEQSPSGLTAGTYTVVVTDSKSCMTTTSVLVGQPVAALAVTETHENVSCNGEDDGSIDLSVTGGTTLYTYAWTTVDGVIPAGQEDDEDLSGLVAGTYSVVITDAHSCVTSTSVVVTEPAVLAVTETHENVSCNGEDDGSIDLSVTGGTTPYTYAWTTVDGVIPAGQEDDEDLSGLVAGTYSLVITDAHSCVTSTSVVVTEPAVLAVTETHENVSCNGEDDGSIDLSVTGGTTLYTYAWTTVDGVIPAGQEDDEDLSGLVAGTYSVVITDAHSCVTSTSVVVTEPAVLAVTETHENVSCNGEDDGSIDLSVTGGTTPYTYAWTTVDGVIPAGQEDDEDLSGLVAGTYSVVITDAHSCVTSTSVVVTEPAVLAVTETHENVSCNGEDDGSIDLSVTGGTTLYTYAWTTVDGVIPAGQEDDEDLSGLVAGTYSVVITDAHSCVTSTSVVVTEPAVLAVTETHENVSCNGEDDGSIDLSVTGGTTPYTYAWTTVDGVIPAGQEDDEDLSGLVAGTYSVVITDAHSCVTSTSVVVTEPAVLAVTETHENVSCNGEDDGSIDLSVTGGTTLYTYAWTTVDGVIPAGQEDDEDLSGLVAGTYSVVITDAHSCVTSTSVVVTEPAVLAVTETHENVSCNGEDDGSIDLSVTGGTTLYTYAWTTVDGVIPAGQEDDEDLSGLVAGTYSVVITDAHSCVTSTSVVVTEPVALTIATAQVTVPISCASGQGTNNNGEITVTATGGTAPYMFTNGGPLQNNGVFAGLTANTYTIVVTDFNNCSTSTMVSISEPAPIVAFTCQTDDLCQLNQGSVTVEATGGTGALTVSWTAVANIPPLPIGTIPGGSPAGDVETPIANATYTGLTGNCVYTFTVTDANGCKTP